MSDASCHVLSQRVGEAEIGTAPTASAWVCLEQSGPWGAKAFTQSHLDPQLGKAFEDAASRAGVRPQLIRRPGRHADLGTARRHVLIASTRPGASWLLQGEIDNPARVLELDFDTIAAGAQPDWPELTPATGPVLLVCTNARRDLCCATLGREVARDASVAYPGRVWESSHLSGHRFAATTALLPSGHLHGRVDDGAAILATADRGLLLHAGWRGRSTWDRAGQVAEGAVRDREDLWALDAVSVRLHGSDWLVSAGDETWTVAVAEYVDGEAPPSCGKAPEPVHRFRTAVQ